MDRPRKPLPKVPLEVWAILIIALLFRLAFYFHHVSHGLRLEHDPSLYLALAEGIGRGSFSMFLPLDIPETTRMPGLPYLIHALGSLDVLLVTQVLVSSLKIPLVHSLGRVIGLRGRMLLVPPLLMAMEPVDVILAGSVLTESIFTTLLLAGLLLLFGYRTIHTALAAAVLLSAAAYMRPNGIHLALLAGGLMFFDRSVERWRPLLTMISAVILLLPWVLRNHALDGRFHLSDSGVVVASHFHVPEVLELAGAGDRAGHRDHLRQLANATDWTDRAAMRNYFEVIGEESIATFLDHPLEWILLQSKKAVRIMIAPGRGYMKAHFPGGSGSLLIVWSAMFSGLVIIGMVGMVFFCREGGWPLWSLWILPLFFIFGNALSTADARFKNPVMPMMLLLSAWVIQQWASRSSAPAITRWSKGTSH